MKLPNQDASCTYLSNPSPPPLPMIEVTRKLDVDAPAAIWSGVEVCVGIVGACMPTLRPIVTWLSTSITKTISRGSSSAGSSAAAASAGNESKSNLAELGLQPLRRPSSAYLPDNTRVEEAPPLADRAKRNRGSETYWPLGAGDGDV